MENLLKSSAWKNANWSILLLLFLYSCSSSEPDIYGTIRGKIVSTLNDEPLQGVNVTLSPGSYSTVTGADGCFEFVDLEPGQYSLQAQKSDYKTNYKQITTVAGQVVSGDLSLTPLQTTSSVEVAPSELDFGTTQTELTFDIRNTGNIGSIEWSISGIDVDWLQVNPMKGTTGQGMASTVKVALNRALLTVQSVTYLTVNIPGGSNSVRIIASPSNSSK